jgi:hypothetical protein
MNYTPPNWTHPEDKLVEITISVTTQRKGVYAPRGFEAHDFLIGEEDAYIIQSALIPMLKSAINSLNQQEEKKEGSDE